MLVVGILGLIAVVLVRLTQSRQNGWGLKAAFSIIFVFMALRYDYGNDYMAYLRKFNCFASYYSSRAVDVTDMWWEPGWVLLNFFFAPFGFYHAGDVHFAFDLCGYLSVYPQFCSGASISGWGCFFTSLTLICF